ncbi:ferric-dicitrate binding protein FerR, regulates iron transport through sigma-19 [Chitinophaga eiseniae]|uniref:Ferric-dicitrate binding protein FerR, regulates iron transport through sigma-19 n=1 Tax=Chitinophaga eiseniae TaxID=634771 RepID=A0A1T4KFE6_9BACT|nr:hypothetical protein [Chitinophaga eiseniae]SJZ41149.1 ferric-dicitrate binding protein FerR, regulates iron transport through sigma-19 [Chitinophaga eiseniae]
MPAIDELIIRFIQTPHDPALQEAIAALVAESPEQARYVENKLAAWLAAATPPVAATAAVKTTLMPAFLYSIKTWVSAVVLLVLAVILLLLNSRATPRKLLSHVNNTGRIDSLHFPGGYIILNKNAAISFDSSQRQSIYAVISEGDVFIDLGSNTSCTVLVPGDYQLETTAGAFHVQASASRTKVFVTRGAIGVSGKRPDTMTLTASMQGTLDQQRAPARKQLASQAPLAWKTGELAFRNVPAAEILEAVSGVYGIHIMVPPSAESLCAKKLTINLNKKTEKETIALLQQSLSAHLVKDSMDRYYLTIK